MVAMPNSLQRLVRLNRLLRNRAGRRIALDGLQGAYFRQMQTRIGIPTVPVTDILQPDGLELKIRYFPWKNGNVSYSELLYLCMIVKTFLKPGQNFLEIGTFNGASIFNIANCVPDGSVCYTIDLPPETKVLDMPHLPGDLNFIRSPNRAAKVHLGLANVRQIYSDSMKFDYSTIKFNGAFIDGGHLYDVVKSDTVNVLKHIGRPGFVIWHDFYGINDIVTALSELSGSYKLLHIENTNICFTRLD